MHFSINLAPKELNPQILRNAVYKIYNYHLILEGMSSFSKDSNCCSFDVEGGMCHGDIKFIRQDQ